MLSLRKLKRILLCSAAIGAISCTMALPAMAAPIPVRGIVEGFYGTPWTQQQRVDMLAFCKQAGFNAFIYAPKDDAYSRKDWRLPYPKEELRAIGSLAQSAAQQDVLFIFALSPGLDMHLEGDGVAEDRAAALAKFQALYDAGVREFAVFFDDIPAEQKDGKGQAEFLNWIDANFVKQHKDIRPLVTVPTEYFYEDMQVDGLMKPYTRDFSQTVNPDIFIVYTGNAVVGDGLPDRDYMKACLLYHRQLSLWWNYPVTDYMENKLALGPVEKLPTQIEMPAIFYNPMKYPEASKITLATGADYANNPRHYDAEASWQKALQSQYGSLADDMELFALQSQHLENSWAKVGRPDDAELAQAVQAYLQASASERAAKGQAVTAKLQRLDTAAQHLLDKLPANKLAEMKPQLLQLRRIIAADELGMELLMIKDNGENVSTPEQAAKMNQFYRQYNNVKAHDAEARISETGARALLDGLHEQLTE